MPHAPADPAASLPANGTWFITCADLIDFIGRRHDLILEFKRRDGIWDREALGHTPTLVSSLHEFTLQPGESEGVWRAQGRIDPDPWRVIAGDVELTLALPCGTQSTGSYQGTFAAQPIHGIATGRYEPQYPPPLGRRRARPAILEDFLDTRGSGRLYDFAHAGRGTTDPCPTLPVFDALQFGVKPDSGEESIPAIQAALDAAGAAGGGVVQLPPGILDCNVHRKLPTLRIRHPRVVLRGAGSGPEGTLLVNHRYSDSPEPKKPWLAGQFPLLHLGPESDAPPLPLTNVLAGQRGSTQITVENSAALRIGQPCLLRQLETDGSLAQDLVQNRVKVAANWRGEGRELVSQLATITAIDGPHVTLDAPLHRSISLWPAQLCAFDMLDRVGVCSLRIRGLWDGFFVHHKNPEHDNGWDQVRFARVRHGYARDLVHENATTALGLSDCLGCVVLASRLIGNPGHNSFTVTGRSTGNLLRDCHAGRNMHGFNMQGTIAGNAVVDCSMDEPCGIDLHGGIGCDNLIDNLIGGINKGGGSGNAVPPRHGPGLTFWNWAAGHFNPYKVWQRHTSFADHDTTPGFIAIGVHGLYGQQLTCLGPDGPTDRPMATPWGWVESPGQRVTPRSLYDWQSSLHH